MPPGPPLARPAVSVVSGASILVGVVALTIPPLAHVGHWLWVLYLPPLLFVLGAIARTKLRERRERDE